MRPVLINIDCYDGSSYAITQYLPEDYVLRCRAGYRLPEFFDGQQWFDMVPRERCEELYDADTRSIISHVEVWCYEGKRTILLDAFFTEDEGDDE